VLARDEADEVTLDLHRVVLAGQRKPLREPANVCIDHDSLGLAQLGRHDVCGLARNSGQAEQVVQTAGHLTAEFL